MSSFNIHATVPDGDNRGEAIFKAIIDFSILIKT